MIEWMDLGNGSSEPVLETGATCHYRGNRQIMVHHGAYKFGLGDTMINARAARDNVGTESVRIVNGSANHMRLAASANEWAIAISGGNMVFSLIGGTGGQVSAPNFNATSELRVAGTKVVSGRKTGYTNPMTRTANRATAYATGTITLIQLAERVKALEDDLTLHGLIGV